MPNPPPAPDFLAAANQQGAANTAAAQQQSRINNPNVSNWWGNQSVTYGPDGTPNVTQTLSPQQQALWGQYTQNQGTAGNTAAGLFGSVSGIDWSKLPGMGSTLNTGKMPNMGSALDPSTLPAMPGNYGDVRNQVIDAMMGRANIELGQQGDQMNSDLIARGLHPGTEAYTREQDALGRQRNDALQQAQLAGNTAATQAIQADLARRAAATGEQAQTFGQQTTNRGLSAAEQAQLYAQMMGNRQQGYNEQAGSQGLTLQQIQALMSGSSPSMPNFPGYQGNTQVAPAPVYGATTAASNYDVDVWNALQQQRNSQNAGLFGLGNTFLQNGGGNLIGQGLGALGNYFFGG